MDVSYQIKEALSFIDPNLPHDQWVIIGMGIKSELPDGFHIFDNWSKRGDSYNPKDTKATWESIKSNGGISIGSLYFLAQKNGWVIKQKNYENNQHNRARNQIVIEHDSRKIQALIEDTAERSRIVWEMAVPASLNHGYLAKKKVLPIGIGEVGSDCTYIPKHIKHSGKCLVIPMHDIKGFIYYVQFITESGQKSFIQGKQKPGIFFRVGNGSNSIAIVESAITGLSYYHSTGETVYCAFSAGALMKVGVAIRRAYPYAAIKIIADDDWAKSINIGVTKALEAASKINAKVFKPNFDGFLRKPEQTDYNDLCVLRRQCGSN